jgi:hypothetical protein
MLLSINLPESLPFFRSCVVGAIHVASGDEIEPGSKILDFSIDLIASILRTTAWWDEA